MDSNIVLDKNTIIILCAIIAFLSSLIGSLVTMFTTIFIKYIDNKRYNKQIIINAAIENWKRTSETLDQVNWANKTYDPLDSFLIHMIKFSELFLDKKIKRNKIKTNLQEIREINSIITEHLTAK